MLPAVDRSFVQRQPEPPEVITAASETGRAKTAEAAGEISVVRKGNILLLSGKGALTKEALKNMDFSGITEIQIQPGITTIASGAFQDQKTVQRVSLPDSVLTIETNAFRGCEALEEIHFGKSLKTIGSFAFTAVRAWSLLHFRIR